MLWPMSALTRRLRQTAASLALIGAALVFASPSPATAIGSDPNTGAWSSQVTDPVWAGSRRDSFVYTVTMPSPHRHEFNVALEFSGLSGDRAILELPKWNPGAYHLTDAHRNLRAVTARALGSEGPALAVTKLDENTWEVAHGGQPFSGRVPGLLRQLQRHRRLLPRRRDGLLQRRRSCSCTPSATSRRRSSCT